MASPTKYLVFCLTALFFIAGAESRLLSESSMRQRYQEWATRYGKQYSTLEETESRYQIFAENVNRIDAFNAAGNKTYTLGVNQYADLTDDEFAKSRKGYKQPQGRPSSRNSLLSSSSSSFQYEGVSVSDLPSFMDWRQRGAVTPVKYQGECECCWAFSAVAAVEGIVKIKTGALISLSEQELVDCDTITNSGCDGGWMDDAFEFIQENGLSTEYNYPYQGTDNYCALKPFQRKATIDGYEYVPANDETSLLKAVAHQPVSVAIDSSSLGFMYYESGVFNEEGCSTTDLDHAVTVVGYGVDEYGNKYWTLKNSWGEGWGEQGYIRVLRDVDQPEGLCGIATEASYPTKYWRFDP